MTQDRSLKTTVLWFIYALVIGVSFLTFVPSYLQQRNTLRAEYLARGKALAKNLNYNSRQPLLSKDYKALYALVDSLMREPDIHWVAIQDAAGRVVAQNGADRIQWQKGEPDSGEKAEQVRIRPYELGRNETVLDIQVENVVKEQPVAESGSPAELMFLEGLTEQPGKAAVSQEKYLGTVHVGLSLKSMQAKQRRLTWLLGLVLIIAMILGTGAGLYFSNTFLQPINQLVGIMENIASNQGDLTRRIDLHRRDELGKLAEAFNRFLGNLRQIVANTIALINRMNESVEEVAATSEQVNGTADAINTSVRAFIEDLQRQEEETTATTTMLNQVTAALQDTTQKSEGASRLFMETENLSEQGKKTVQDSVSHIDGITENMGVIERRMQNLTNSLDEIGRGRGPRLSGRGRGNPEIGRTCGRVLRADPDQHRQNPGRNPADRKGHPRRHLRRPYGPGYGLPGGRSPAAHPATGQPGGRSVDGHLRGHGQAVRGAENHDGTHPRHRSSGQKEFRRRPKCGRIRSGADFLPGTDHQLAPASQPGLPESQKHDRGIQDRLGPVR